MLLRKNTRAFKTIVDIFNACQRRPDREKLIRLYITKAGHSIDERIPVEGIQGDVMLFYEMNFQSIREKFASSNHQLHESDDTPGIYFFRSASNKSWDETPFEFDEAVTALFASLADLPSTRKKEKAAKYELPTAPQRSTATPSKKADKGGVKGKAVMKVVKTFDEPRQPNYHLPHKIHFTNLDSLVFRLAGAKKRDVLDYYAAIADTMLPYMKDRPQQKLASLVLDDEPAWLKKKNDDTTAPLVNDKQHLLFYVEQGAIDFATPLAKSKSIDSPDSLIIAIGVPGSSWPRVIDVTHATHEVVRGLKLPSFIKTDGIASLHIHIPLDGKSDFAASREAAEYICKLVRLKIPALATLADTQDEEYGKVPLDYTLNERDRNIIAPYSLLPGQHGVIAAPLSWDEVHENLQIEDFTIKTMEKRLKKEGDAFEGFFKKTVNADAVCEQLKEGYGFLVS